MTFGNPWMLLLAPVPLLWLWYEWQRGVQHIATLLKSLAMVCIALALAEPRMTTSETKMAVSVLVDTSASISNEDIGRANAIVKTIALEKGRHWTKIIPFARATRTLGDGETIVKLAAGEQSRGTDIEAAVRDGIAAMPEGLVPRVLLISDGKENKGSVARATWQAQQLGVPIDTIAMAGRPKPALRLESAIMPALAFTGDRFPIDLEVISPRKTSGTIEITAEGKLLGSTPVKLEEGMNQLRVHATVSVAGAIDVSGTIKTGDLGEARFARSIMLRRPKLLYLSQDPEGAEKHLLEVLAASQLDVTRLPALPVKSFDEYQLIVLNNWDLEAIAPARKADLEAFVKQGGGLLVIGGEKNTYVENKNNEDVLERALPAKLAPPRSPEGTLVVLIIDKSSSMEGKKMELARLASIGVIENLRPIDQVGVLIFDNSFQWAVPIRKAEDRNLIKRLVAGITPDGGTQIAPALTEAFRKALPSKATFKHIVLLTDGISEEGDSMSLAKEAESQKVTISTVGLGQDVNRAYLEKIAAAAKGKSYFLNDPAGLEQILLRDVMEHTGSTAIEKPIVPIVLRQAEILEGINMESAPPLKGYVKFTAKPTADTILSIDRKDPLFTRWQYGLGRSAVWTSDAKSRWADAWITWKGFDKFWSNVMRDLLPHAQPGEASVELDNANSELVVDYRLARHMEEPKTIPAIFVFGPDGFRRPVEIRKVGDGSYRGKVPVGSRQGLFRLRPVEDSRAFPEVGYYRQEEELSDYGSNEQLMRQIAAYTGGRFNPDIKKLFETGGRSVPSVMRLWPGLLALAIALNLAELILRKWRGVFKH